MKKGYDKALLEFKKYLPEISRVGSKDDMSVASIYNDTNKGQVFSLLTDYQMRKYEQQADALQKKISELNAKKEQFGNQDHLNDSDTINYNYICKDIEKLEKKLERVN